MPAPEPGTVGTLNNQTCALPISYMKILAVYITPFIILLALTRKRLSKFWLAIAAHAICVHMGWYQKLFADIGINSSEIGFGVTELFTVGKSLLSKAAGAILTGWIK